MASRTSTRPPSDTETRRSRRAFSRRQWARRWLTWKYVVAALLVLALLVGGTWLVLFSSVLSVKQVEVTGTDNLSAQQVLGIAGVEDGTPLARIDLDSVATRVAALAEVRDVEVTRQWPGTVVISVDERVAIATIDVGGATRALDLEGEVFKDDPRALADLPRVETAGGISKEAREEAATVVAALPEDLAGTVDHVEVVTVDQVSLVMRDGRTVVWGSADDSDVKAEVLATMVREDREADIDVSVPGRPSFLP